MKNNKKFDVVGLGACGVDLRVKVPSLSSKNQKITTTDFKISEGGVTANNIVQSAKLGLNTAWVGALGDDNWGSYLVKKFEEKKVKAFPEKFSKTPTQQFWIATDPQGEWNMIGILGASRKLTPRIVRNKFSKVISQAKHFHTEVAVIPLSAALEGAKIAKKNGAKVLLDIDGDPFYLIEKEKIGTKNELISLLKKTDVVKLSEAGALGLARKKYFSKKIITDILSLGPRLAVVTLGEKGCFIGTEKKIIYCPGFKIKSADTVGAGDAFMGGLSFGILRNWPLEKIGRFANACGAFKCTRFGTRSSGNLREINNFLKRNA